MGSLHRGGDRGGITHVGFDELRSAAQSVARTHRTEIVIDTDEAGVRHARAEPQEELARAASEIDERVEALERVLRQQLLGRGQGDRAGEHAARDRVMELVAFFGRRGRIAGRITVRDVGVCRRRVERGRESGLPPARDPVAASSVVQHADLGEIAQRGSRAIVDLGARDAQTGRCCLDDSRARQPEERVEHQVGAGQRSYRP